jgi:hypothetical protein
LLQEEASRTIAGFALTNANYSKAIDLLHERFGQNHKIVHSYLQALLELPSPRNTLTSLRHFHDQVETFVRGLESFGQTQDTYGSLLVPIILNKLPSEIRKHLAREHGSTDWLLGDLRRSLFRELEVLEAGTTGIELAESGATATFFVHSGSSHKPRHYNLNPQKLHLCCRFCKESHLTSDCYRFQNHNDRMKIVRQKCASTV